MLSDQSSIWHLESYRSLLMSQMSREDTKSHLKIVSIPEVFADPPVFSIRNFMRSDEQECRDEVGKILKKYRSTCVPQKKKPLLDEFLRECDLDPLKVVSFTTNSSHVYNSVKLVDHHLNWHFTKS